MTKGAIAVDDDAKQFGVSPSEPVFFDRALEALQDANRKMVSRRLLQRYVPEGPGADTPAARWEGWWKENHSYLFFSDAGGYRWYIDPLAKRRGVPTEKLRGSKRAALPAE